MDSAAPPPRATDDALLARVDACMAGHVERAAFAPNLAEAVRYALLGGGKRIRPLLVLRCEEALRGEVDEALDAAAAIEMVHAFSLVHDDLPALDNDSLRRGRPTLHVAFGEAMAILAGDALLALAMQAACAPARCGGQIATELVRATNAMITGQVYDTLGGLDPALTAEERVRTIHRNKTGALLRCACRMGAIAAGAAPREAEALDRFGEALGLMFQAVDDLIDETQTVEHAGKAVGKDRQSGKVTYPAVFGIEKTRQEIERLHRAAVDALSPLGGRAAALARMSEALAARTR